MRRTLYDQDHEDFRKTVRDFVEREIIPNKSEYEREGMIGRSVWRSAGDLGLLGLCVPEQYGGAGADDYRFNAVMDEELTRAGLAYSCALGVHTHVVAPYLVERTTEEQRQRWLPGFCSGEMITGVAMSEPGGGSDLAALRTKAERDGDDWLISGSKIFITNGYSADFLVVAARTTPDTRSKGITLFGVPTDSAGFTRGRKLDKVGQTEGDTAELFFDKVRVPSANIIGELDGGFGMMMQHLAQERLASAVCNITHAGLVLDATLAYARERRAFGQSIGSFQYNRFILADLQTSIDVTRAYVDACVAASSDGDITAVDASKAKLWSSEVQGRVTDTCLQMFGGYGFMNESQVARDWKDARVTRIWAGTSEIMRDLISRSLDLQ
ncbi:acyl-CoA dehydrogenase family protein [Gordonia McavH-238-E]|uniref:acyl-CoA dehydrogenase family protein n=1 Tax=Gordonia sp. McavH-238-E TaxID=2917736 RepID=UPI001EF414A5|nr:acyl-CoA dehydrogenase family protein [Gordonia sp. McavH-238-E]MCG7633279.1 acyl-CoA dehydrogenase family protein [Gordonia sp. McavH-238-E]